MSAAPEKNEAETPLAQLTARLADIKTASGHTEMWGVELSDDASHAPTQVILQKFLRANNGDLAGAEKQLTDALSWRREAQPASLVNKVFSKHKFDNLGFVSHFTDDTGKKVIITWHVYGAIKDNNATFGDVDEFIRWRAALMELGVQHLNLNDIKEPLAEDGSDPYQLIQVHDYKSVSFFNMDPVVKAATQKTIAVFATGYPELLYHKYFVNVPALMGWVFAALKYLLPAGTVKKMHPMGSGTSLVNELPALATSLPPEYGGSGRPVQESQQLAMADVPEEAKEGDAPGEAASKPEGDQQEA
ncbi:phosphatidylinositol transfer protein [Trichoderma austrokoningii]